MININHLYRNLSSNGLSGILQESLSDLSELVVLDLAKNTLHGGITTVFRGLTKLEVL